jgi:hypothetical protein
MSAPTWNELRAAGRVVFDHPGRKLAIYPNEMGQVVFLYVEDGRATYGTVDPEEVTSLGLALGRAWGDAEKIAGRLDAEYQTFEALEKARGG